MGAYVQGVSGRVRRSFIHLTSAVDGQPRLVLVAKGDLFRRSTSAGPSQSCEYDHGGVAVLERRAIAEPQPRCECRIVAAAKHDQLARPSTPALLDGSTSDRSDSPCRSATLACLVYARVQLCVRWIAPSRACVNCCVNECRLVAQRWSPDPVESRTLGGEAFWRMGPDGS